MSPLSVFYAGLLLGSIVALGLHWGITTLIGARMDRVRRDRRNRLELPGDRIFPKVRR